MSDVYPQRPDSTPTNPLTQCIRACNDRGDGALMPFIVIGDPDLQATHAVVDALVAGGADILEFGFPFSDPPADGPVIQAADVRALNNGTTPVDCLAFIAEVRARHDHPIALLLYYNLVLQHGQERFFRDAADAGVDAVLVADVPLEESGPLRAAAASVADRLISNVLIASELSTDARLDQVAEVAGGYLYAVSRVGITGEQQDVAAGLQSQLDRFRRRVPLPVLVGFGISSPDHVSAAMAAGADGVISGSAIVRRIAQFGVGPSRDIDKMSAAVTSFTADMKAATRGTWRKARSATSSHL
ncbi:MAG: tryptophan synthase subunit alpha [Myxococcales bacterium]|nr:tryptophan synthase subunit alpha [Myxococcales bacterium]